jgi:hypothetical protein
MSSIYNTQRGDDVNEFKEGNNVLPVPVCVEITDSHNDAPTTTGTDESLSITRSVPRTRSVPPLQVMSILPNNATATYQETKEQLKSSSTRAASRRNRVYAFRDFILNTYGSYLQECESVQECGDSDSEDNDNVVTILDVAGGKGILSWLLTNDATLFQKQNKRIECILVDPRIANHQHMERSVEFLQANPDIKLERSKEGTLTHQPLATLLQSGAVHTSTHTQHPSSKQQLKLKMRRPKQLCLFMDNDLIQAIQCRKEAEAQACRHTSNSMRKIPVDGSNPNHGVLLLQPQQQQHTKATIQIKKEWSEFILKALQKANTDESVQGDPNNRHSNNLQLNNGAGQLLEDPEDIWHTVFQKISLIVGFHPDQATEACLDLAASGVLPTRPGRKHNGQVPFAVVPCCVFPKLFPDRVIHVPVPGTSTDNDNRTTTEGEGVDEGTFRVVKTYDSFVTYLKNKPYPVMPMPRNVALLSARNNNHRGLINLLDDNGTTVETDEKEDCAVLDIHQATLPFLKDTARNIVLFTQSPTTTPPSISRHAHDYDDNKKKRAAPDNETYSM